MGITGELVRNVFSKKLSIQRHENRAKSNSAERKKWSISVRSYLCGDEHNSTFATEDAVSVNLANSFRSNKATNYTSTTFISTSSVYAEAGDSASEATVNQPLHEDNSKDHENRNEKENSISSCKLFKQEDAAVIIQSAFRSFRARRASEEEDKREEENNEPKGSPSRESSIGTSIEVQTGNSSDIFSFKEESFDACHPTRNRPRAQVLKLQEDWDDSKISSTKSKMRIQNRLEAATRRERALAYAFSQQLRICSKKKQSTTNGDETNMGWNWLERWMAARQPENESMEDHEIGNNNQNGVAKKRSILMDAGLIEEKESCGSNEVSSLFEVNIININGPKSSLPRPSIPRNKVTRNLSRQNSASSHLCPRESKDTKKLCHMEDEKDKRTKQSGNKRDVKHKYATTDQVSLELERHGNMFSFGPNL